MKYKFFSVKLLMRGQYVIDAKYRGNKARFINHGKEYANLVSRVIFFIIEYVTY